MTHPFHPLRGRTFEAVSTGRGWAEERVWFVVGKERTRALPLSWTDMGPPDPYIEIGRGRSCFRVEDLLSLSSLIREMRK